MIIIVLTVEIIKFMVAMYVSGNNNKMEWYNQLILCGPKQLQQCNILHIPDVIVLCILNA